VGKKMFQMSLYLHSASCIIAVVGTNVITPLSLVMQPASSLREAFLALECAAKRMGLRINQEKTKYMISGQCTM
jgi:hypothetical protein